jgi:uncharacterized protein
MQHLRFTHLLCILICVFALGTAHAITTPPGTDISSLHTAAEMGDANAQARLGDAYYHGHGTARDLSSAEYWYRLAAERGHLKAKYQLGELYLQGKEVDPHSAAEWFRRAAERGHAESQFRYGMLLASGAGVETDKEQARRWLQRAAEQGVSDAQWQLERMRAARH